MRRDFPIGIITAWYGSTASIPGTFRLCDGTLKTPDLRGKFIRGANVAFPPGTLGGLSQHGHPFTGDTHSHSLVGGSVMSLGSGMIANTSFDAATGTTDNSVSLPPYHSLCYIMYAGRLA